MKNLIWILLIGISLSLFSCGKDAREHEDKGLIYLNQGKLDEALVEFNETIRLAPKSPLAYFSLEHRGRNALPVS